MAKDSHKKSVLYEVPQIQQPTSLQFSRDKFQSSINSKGYNVTVENCIKCSCRDRISGQPRLDCVNCGGIGYIFVNKRSTVAVIQNMARNKQYRNHTEIDLSNVSITFRPQDDIAELDRVINLDLLSIYTETVKLKDISGTWKGLMIYYPQEVTHAYLFISHDIALVPLTLGDDFTINENQIILDSGVDLTGMESSTPQISVRYEHNPVFHIINITREKMGAKQDDCATGEKEMRSMPIHCIGQRTHYMIDYPDFNGESVEDNSDLSNIDIENNTEIRLPL